MRKLSTTIEMPATELSTKYTDGRYIQISRASDLKALGKTGFLGIDKTGNEIDGYIITKDIDFAGESLAMPESFRRIE